jgi:hypothetical protein
MPSRTARLAAAALVAGLLVAGTPSPAQAAPVSDNFNRADSTDLGAGWTETGTDLAISGNKLTNPSESTGFAQAVGGTGNRVRATVQAPATGVGYAALAVGVEGEPNDTMVFVKVQSHGATGSFTRLFVGRGNNTSQGESTFRDVTPFAAGTLTVTLLFGTVYVVIETLDGDRIVESFQLASPVTGSGVGVGAYGGAELDTFVSSDHPQSQPGITSSLSSAAPVSSYGWYRTPVTISYTCTPDGTPVTCPEPQVADAEGAGLIFGASVQAEDGGSAISVVQLDMDQTRPTVKLTGLGSAPYLDDPQDDATCVAVDAVSGLPSPCAVTARRLSKKKVQVVASATDRAGNVGTASQVVLTTDRAVLRATFKRGGYLVKRGKKYAVVVLGPGKPVLLGVGRADLPRPLPFTKKKGRWQLKVTIPGDSPLGRSKIRLSRKGKTFTVPITVRR